MFCKDADRIIALLSKQFERGWRWRPDNSFLICYYKDYDTPPIQFDHESFNKAAIFCLLKSKGVAIIL